MEKEIISLAQLKEGYRYNSDSLILADFILNCGIKNESLDVGSGCGILGILFKTFNKDLRLSVIDIQEENIKLIRQNLDKNHIEAEIFYDDFLKFRTEKKFDFIVSNPPFYRQDACKSENIHKNISKFQSYLPLDEFISKANSILKPRGILYFCYEASMFDQICVALEKKKLKMTKICFVYTDQNEKARLVLVQARKSVKSSCEILPPFFVYENGILSQKMQTIHSRFRLKSYDF
ncbi:tRNA1(Val) (adenine(37)-N6)-methyltransferase [Campylobacter aviculae]|uniref:Methyltransferase n=1 Tax=Campylobacter aviculae TaxID=2510190 RepID=A0A4U7BM44_9BACT|nr:methyltransferase [Campylobacter aviculae]TKX29946.1 methyltransferase [Campylobacter aviculae]